MYHFKLFIFGLLCVNYAGIATAVETWNDDESLSKDLKKSIPLSSDEYKPKVNWTPILQQVEQDSTNDLGSDIVGSDSDIAYIPQEVPGVVISPVRIETVQDDTCELPNGLGLKNLLKQAGKILPHERLRSIIVQAKDDAEIVRVKDLLKSETFRSKVHDLINSSHFIILRDYVCHALNLNVKYYFDFVRNLFETGQFTENSDEKPQSVSKGRRPGVRGLIEDLNDAIPKQELHDLYVRLLISDEHLNAAMRRLKSNDFRQLLRNLTTVDAFQDMKRMLLDVGIPLEDVKKFIDKSLGWQDDELVVV